MQLTELFQSTHLNAGVLDVVVTGSSAKVCSVKRPRVFYVAHHLSSVQSLGSRGDQIKPVLLQRGVRLEQLTD